MEEKLYQLALKFTPGVGDVLIRQLVSYCGSASEVFRAGTGRLTRIPGIGESVASKIHRKEALIQAEKELTTARERGVEILFYTDRAYPNRLKTLYDAPAVLYYQGNGDLNTTRTIGIVGTRQATEYGRKITEEIIAGLQPFAPFIISGLAYGIDIAAHRASLKCGLPTLGVLASGLDIIYPASHGNTAESMCEAGGLITENGFGVKPDAPRFPARNRIIAGMSDALIVVEAATKGGALITAEYANNYHREVFAVPGDVNRVSSSGCNKLIAQHKASIFTDVTQIVELLNWDAASSTGTPTRRESGTPTQSDSLSEQLIFTNEESQVIALLRTQKEMLMDDLSWQSQIPVNRLASLLLNLEFQGVVKALPGKKFVLH